MRNLVHLIIVFIALPMTFFILYLWIFAFLSLVFGKGKRRRLARPKASFAIVIPAHNEELLIGELLDNAANLHYPRELYDVYVVADNCSDGTANVVKDKGGYCFERKDESRRGKGYALEWIFKQIPLDQYDAFVIVDADTIFDPGFLKVMNDRLERKAAVIQGYFGTSNPDDSWLTRLMLIPGSLKFKLRYRAKSRLGLTTPLMGNGMCFSRKIIEKYGWDAFSITENWEYFAKLTLRGVVVDFAEDAVILSQEAASLRQGGSQRTRWIKGRSEVLRRYFLQLTAAGLRRRSIIEMDAAIELLLPSLSMLFNAAFLSLFLCLLLLSADSVLLWWTGALVLALGIYFLIGLSLSQVPRRTWLALPLVPLFLIWKLRIKLLSLIDRDGQEWVRTQRHGR